MISKVYLIKSTASFAQNVFGYPSQAQKRIALLALGIIALVGALYMTLRFFWKQFALTGRSATLETEANNNVSPSEPALKGNETTHVPQEVKKHSSEAGFSAAIQGFQQEIESLIASDSDSASWNTECRRLSDKIESIRTSDRTSYHPNIHSILLHTHWLLSGLAKKNRSGLRTDLSDIEYEVKQLKKDPEIFFALLGSLKKLAQPFLGKDRTIQECIQEIPRFIQNLKELKVLSLGEPESRKIAEELSEEMHICREHWQLKLPDEKNEPPAFEIFKHSTTLVDCIASNETDLVELMLPDNITHLVDHVVDDQATVDSISSSKALFASLADETAQLKSAFLGLRASKDSLSAVFESIMQKLFIEKVPASIEQCKAFVYGANFLAQREGGVNPEKVFTRLELILGPLESDVALLRARTEQAPEGFTPIALGLSTGLHSYTLLKTPTGALHAFSNVKGLEEGYLGPKRVPPDIAKAAFERNMEPLFRHPLYQDSQIPFISQIVFVKDEYVDTLTNELDAFHDLPWFGNKCGALRAMTLALVMIRAKQIAEASR